MLYTYSVFSVISEINMEDYIVTCYQSGLT